MKFFYSTLLTLCLLALPAYAQSSLAPRYGYEIATWFPDYPNIGAFDFSDTLFFLNDGDTIHMLGVRSGTELKKYGKPADYSANNYATFLTLSPDGNTIWAGYTSDGAEDDRIYSIDVTSGRWELQATFPGNMDLIFWNDSILVSGLNSPSWEAPSAIFILDTTGLNHHRRIIEPGGYSAGMAIDQQNNLYYGTSYAVNPNALYRWDNSMIQLVAEFPDRPVLQVSHGEKLSDLPGGVYDCEVDAGGNVLFNMNLYGGIMSVCKWNGNKGDGHNLDTLATASGEYDWLGSLKSKGDISQVEPGNMVVTYSFGQPLAILTHINTVGVKMEQAPEFLAFPNPTRGIFTIRSATREIMEVKVYTIQGSLVYAKSDFVSGTEIDLSGQSAGSFILQVTDSQGITSKIIQKL
ncbi:MAG: T9SS type A sorting domain-containing protein [Bacteroidales bacterium]|nr:T9SS type A sorting domain-containing protein [Bacteroidales bacterium]